MAQYVKPKESRISRINKINRRGKIKDGFIMGAAGLASLAATSPLFAKVLDANIAKNKSLEARVSSTVSAPAFNYNLKHLPDNNQTQVYSSTSADATQFNPGNYTFYGTLVDVLENNITLADKTLTFVSPDGIPYTVQSQWDGSFRKDIDTAVDVNDDHNKKEYGYRAYNTGYGEDGMRYIKFETKRAGTANVEIFNLIGHPLGTVNVHLPEPGCYTLIWNGKQGAASGRRFAKIKIKENGGGTHTLGNIVFVDYSGHGGNEFLVDNDSMLKKVDDHGGEPVYDEEKQVKKSVYRSFANNDNQWTLIIEDPTGQYVKHTKFIPGEEGNNDLELQDMLKNDPVLLGLLHGSPGRDGYYKRWEFSPKAVYINNDNVAEAPKGYSIDYLTNGTIDTLTGGKIHIDSDSIKVVPTSGLPQTQAEYDSTIVIDNVGSGSYYAVFDDSVGRITAAYINLSDGASRATILSEVAAILADADDYNEILSITNDGNTLEEPTQTDIDAFNYIYKRRPGTGIDDDERRAGNLAKAGASPLDYNSLSQERQQIVDRLESIYGSRPSSIRFF